MAIMALGEQIGEASGKLTGQRLLIVVRSVEVQRTFFGSQNARYISCE
jgi:hypothetical protein